MKSIYILGDSHVAMFDREYPVIPNNIPTKKNIQFCPRTTPAATAFSVERYDKEIREVLQAITFSEHDEMWFIFGEIDVRFHIFYYHQELNITVDESIEGVVKRYTSYVKRLRDEGYPLHIMSVVPTQKEVSPYREDPLFKVKNPIRGEGLTVGHRIYITEALNVMLENECEKLGIPFHDIYPFIVAETGCNIEEWTRDGMHYCYIGDLVIEKLGLEEDK
jgi:hypothetical protein